MINLSLNNNLALFILAAISLMLCACEQHNAQSLTTIADARNNPAYYIDNGEPGDSVGDILVFDQPLLDKDMKTIGNNSGSCIRTRVGHSYGLKGSDPFNPVLVSVIQAVLVGLMEAEEVMVVAKFHLQNKMPYNKSSNLTVLYAVPLRSALYKTAG